MDSHTQSHGKSRKIRVRGARKTYHRGVKYTVAEDECICRNYVYFTQDSIQGTNQNGFTPWNDIFKKFEEETMNLNVRDANGLSQHFITISREMASYVALISREMRTNNVSGRSEDDIGRDVREEWQRKRGKPFGYESCYYILKVLNKYNPEVMSF